MIALQNFLHTLRRYKAATLLNILGLAVAFAAFYILMVQVRFDLNFDRSYPKAECIYQIALPQFYEEGKGYSSFIPRPDGEKAIAASPHIRQGGCKNTMGISETSLYDPEQGSSAGLNRHPVYQISHGLLEVFGFRCIEGSFARFEEPNTVILSQKTARALYGGKSAGGRSLVFNDDSRHPREVIAVYEDFPDNSSVHNGAITDIGEHFLNRTSNWMYNYLVKLDSPNHMEETRQAIIAGLKTLRPDVKAEVFEKVRLVQLHELYFSPEFQSMFRGNRATVYSLLTIAILVVICVVYTMAVYFGMKGVAKLAASCVYLFFALLAYFLFLGGETRYIIETGITAIGNLTQNFIGMATWTDAMRTSSFPQSWTIFYWAYWMVWCVATPFFIGTISKGRTIRQTVLGGYFFGLAGTFTSFIILGNYGLGLQMHGKLDLMALYEKTGSLYEAIIAVFETMPLAQAGLVLLAVTMIAFYATSFDALTMVASSYSYKALGADEEPDKSVKLFWAVMLMLLPIALIFSENSMANLQTVSIIAAFPIGFIIVLIVWSFFRDARHYLDNEKQI